MDDNGVITVRDLRRRYGGTGGRGFDAVRGVTFSVRRGELFALLGTNGAGKTSTMELAAGARGCARFMAATCGCPCRIRAEQGKNRPLPDAAPSVPALLPRRTGESDRRRLTDGQPSSPAESA